MVPRKEIRIHYLYAIVLADGSPVYIGAGTGRRAEYHFRKTGKFRARLIVEIIEEEGYNPFRAIKLLERLTKKEASAYERAFIRAIGRADKCEGPLLNQTDGGPGVTGLIYTPEYRAKLSAATLGKRKSPEHAAKIAASHTGKKHSAAHTAAMVAGQRLAEARRLAEVHAALEAAGMPRKILIRRPIPQWARQRLGQDSPFVQKSRFC